MHYPVLKNNICSFFKKKRQDRKKTCQKHVYNSRIVTLFILMIYTFSYTTFFSSNKRSTKKKRVFLVTLVQNSA
ncbi:hypothetical protein C1645_784912 [Glomus cerebriforme]|uniref:Uncharacterized protein n=1 Tax=Glomus cerebriforme TaxID=658196 RepID=A0A397SDK4_9GLOM|nr:hypothetical protein C1645_784912 [Glomus cerebriforme]